MAKITHIHAREIIDSRGLPSLEVEVTVNSSSCGRAAVPSGASTGAHEAHELRDGDAKRYCGKGVSQAVNNVLNKISPLLISQEISSQKNLDQLLCTADGSDNKSNLGANAILGVSLAFAKASAQSQGVPLYKYLGGDKAISLPTPLMNVLNGGVHADNGLDVQEFMIVPLCGGSFKEALRAGCEIFQTLKKVLSSRGLSTAVGDEGGFAPRLKSNREALELLCLAVEKSGYKLGKEIGFALDVAATELFQNPKDSAATERLQQSSNIAATDCSQQLGHYLWEGKKISSSELISIYQSWSRDFPILSIEDGFSEDDWGAWSESMGKLGGSLQLVGDDLFVTNPKRLQQGIDKKAANSLLVKVNQIGSLSETREAVTLAQSAGFTTVMSHRSGETEDVTIADLSVALACEQIKTGSLCRGERTAKYNQLLRIEEDLGAKAIYRGVSAFRN